MRPDSKHSRRWMFIGALIAIFFAGGTGCGIGSGDGVREEGQTAESSSSSAPAENSELKHVDLVLTEKVCHLNQPGVMIYVSGVSGSPSGSYYTTVQYRASSDEDWHNYPQQKYDPVGSSEEADLMPDWHWSCTADKNSTVNDMPGEYRFRVSWPAKDEPTAQSDWVTLTVK